MDAFRGLKKLGDKGFAIVYIALMLVVLVAFVSLAVDMGYMYVAKGQLQNAADAGALAGVAKLSNFAAARQAAKDFAEKNQAAGEQVKVDRNDTNDNGGDVVIGYWDKTAGTLANPVPAGKVANAVKVVARRNTETGTGISTDNKQVALFFGQVFNWGQMSAKSEAIACRPPKPSAPVVLCQDLCSKPTPFRVYFNQTQAKDPACGLDYTYTVGWTEFSATSHATDLGRNSVVAELIDGRQDIPLGLCGQTLYTNNGLGQVKNVLEDTFVAKRTPSSPGGTWTILVPIFGLCPSSVSWGERFTSLVQYAQITISDVSVPGGHSGTVPSTLPSCGGPDGYIEVLSISCEACETTNFLGDKASLVK
ncbi:pilus assembly protein TadG-related protein [Geomonas agri]|uniref:pilus assembly protein TadG-related protein n=1 Tax=Geomonas agri TaxID=2873702 RepID=UPI001CD25405|nr:pilus assembly protein TadG-related protein [Geomonas agri]